MAYSAKNIGANASEFATLCTPFIGAIRKIALRSASDPDTADDLTQQTFLEARRSWHTFDTRQPVYPWLYRIVTRVYSRWAKRRPSNRPVRCADLRATVDQFADPEQQVVAREGEFLWALNSRYRRLLVMKYLLGYRYEDIAEREGLSLDNVEALLRRARAALLRTRERVQRQAYLVFWLPGRMALARVRARTARANRLAHEVVLSSAAGLGSVVAVAGIAIGFALSAQSVLGSTTAAAAAPVEYQGARNSRLALHTRTTPTRPSAPVRREESSPGMHRTLEVSLPDTPLGGASVRAWTSKDDKARTFRSRLDGKLLPEQITQSPTYAERDVDLYCDSGITFTTACAVADAVPKTPD